MNWCYNLEATLFTFWSWGHEEWVEGWERIDTTRTMRNQQNFEYVTILSREVFSHIVLHNFAPPLQNKSNQPRCFIVQLAGWGQPGSDSRGLLNIWYVAIIQLTLEIVWASKKMQLQKEGVDLKCFSSYSILA